MSRSFNGSSDRSSTGSFNVVAAGTMSVWFKLAASQTNVESLAIMTHNDGNQNFFGLSYFNNSTSIIQPIVKNTGGFQGGNSTTVVTTGTWFHTSYSYDSTNGGQLYVNGAKDVTTAANGPNNSGAATLGFGWDPGRNNDTRDLAASIAYAGYWNASLTQLEHLALSKGAPPYTVRPGSLYGYWPLDGLQSPEPDLSGNARNSTLTGTAKAFGPPVNMFTPRWPRNEPITPPTPLPLLMFNMLIPIVATVSFHN